MKIVVVVSDPTSGLLQYPIDLAMCFQAQGHDVVVLSWTTKGQNPDLRARLIASPVQLVMEPSLTYPFSPKALLAGLGAKPTAAIGQADLLLTFGPLTAWQTRRYVKKGGISLSMIAAMGHDRTSWWKPRLGAALLNRYTTHVGALCHLEIDRLSSLGVKKSKIILVHNWIDLDRMSYQTQQIDNAANSLLSKLGIAHKGKKFIACLASFQPRKRQDLLIKAFASLAPKHLEYDLILAGSGAELAACQALADDLGLKERVHFVGRLVNDDAMRLLVASTIVVHCSNAETFGYSMVEPLFLEKATLVTKVGIGWEMQNADVAEVVAPDDLAALTAGLERLVNDGPVVAQRISRAKRFVVDNLEANKIATQIVGLVT